jgi:hypothetical protein
MSLDRYAIDSGFLTLGNMAAASASRLAESTDPVSAELGAVFDDWRAENDSALSLGATGDVFHLRLRLNAAFAKSCRSSRDGPSAP